MQDNPLQNHSSTALAPVYIRDVHAAPRTLVVPKETAEQTVSFGHYVWLFKQHWWKIGIVVVACTAAGLIASMKMTPVYEAHARIAVDLKTSGDVVGTITTAGVGASEADEYFNTELQLIQSDVVLRPVALQYHLLGATSNKRTLDGLQASDGPVSLKNLKVTHPANSFIIQISYRDTDPLRAAEVANAVARSYIVQERETRAHASLDESSFMEQQIRALKKNMDDSAAALAGYEKQLGIINPEEKTTLLASRLLQLSTELTDAQADRMRKQVDEEALKSGSKAAVQVSPQAEALVKLDENVRTAQQKMSLVKTIYGSNNIEYKKADNDLQEAIREDQAVREDVGKRIDVEYQEAVNRENMIRSALADAKAQSDALNAHSMDYEELKSQAETNKSLYTELFRKVKEAGINGAFAGSAVRIADPARPQLHPVFPSKVMFTGVGFLFSLLASVLVILLRDVMDKSLRDPQQTRQIVGAEVLGMLPHVRNLTLASPARALSATDEEKPAKFSRQLLESATFYEESIRSILSTILLGRYGHPIRSLVVTSATEGEGKSSCVAHLAVANALQGRRTLLIDADLRCPTQHRMFTELRGNSQHRMFTLDQPEGLSDVIANGKHLREVRQSVKGIPKLDVIPAGSLGAEGCAHVGRAVRELLQASVGEYDMVFIDAPPILCFAEPLQLSCISDGVLVVCKAGVTSREAVASVLSTLQRLGATTLGIVLNQIRPQMSATYSAYSSYSRNRYRLARPA